ncbi:MAG: DNA recombination protein RmuC [Betaproteobacteria bacterium]|nr:DNA recombination protein RmuC [Betaproteobacteria bacterium]
MRKDDPIAEQETARAIEAAQEARHRAMLTDLSEGLAKQGDRIATSQLDASERVRQSVASLQLEQTQNLAGNREEMIRQLAALNLEIQQKQEALKTAMLGGTLEKLNEQSLAQQQKIESTLRMVTDRINASIEGLTKSTDKRLEEIGGKVNERLDEGFKKTNETFVNVIARLATIDEAQKKIDGLTTNVVSLQQLLGDKRSRGALGERQLEDIIKNALPESVYEFQYTFSSGKVRADCVLKLPAPTGLIAVDSKFPLESYERMFMEGPERVSAAVFKTSVKKHVDDIADKYIIQGETGEGAVMFIPAEAVFAEIHGNHRDLIDYAAARRVWLVSPTTLMAVLNTARVVLKDVETRKQIHIIQDELGKLGADFGRFQARMDDLAKHIGQANKDVEQVHISSRKISERFQKIEKAELDPPITPTAIGSTETADLPPALIVAKAGE